jgi:hypothetical protein
MRWTESGEGVDCDLEQSIEFSDEDDCTSGERSEDTSFGERVRVLRRTVCVLAFALFCGCSGDSYYPWSSSIGPQWQQQSKS